MSAQSEEIGKKSHNVNFFCENPNPAQSVKPHNVRATCNTFPKNFYVPNTFNCLYM